MQSRVPRGLLSGVVWERGPGGPLWRKAGEEEGGQSQTLLAEVLLFIPGDRQKKGERRKWCGKRTRVWGRGLGGCGGGEGVFLRSATLSLLPCCWAEAAAPIQASLPSLKVPACWGRDGCARRTEIPEGNPGLALAKGLGFVLLQEPGFVGWGGVGRQLSGSGLQGVGWGLINMSVATFRADGPAGSLRGLPCLFSLSGQAQGGCCFGR